MSTASYLLFMLPRALMQVAERFISFILESSSPPLRMAFFINYNAEDILRQATESTHRYERGTPLYLACQNFLS